MNKNGPIYFNKCFLFSISVIAVLVSCYLTNKLSNPSIFSSSGSIPILAGLLLSIKNTMLFPLRISLEGKYNKYNGIGTFCGEFGKEQQDEINAVLNDEKFGVCFVVIGTLISGYGQYLFVVN